MDWMEQNYQAEENVLGVGRRLIACNPSYYKTTSDAEILHYIDVARGFRDAFKSENAQQNGNRNETECADAVRARLQLPQRDEERFYPTTQCDYLSPERLFLLACVAVTGSRKGATLIASIALTTRVLKGIQTHVNQCCLHSSVPNE